MYLVKQGALTKYYLSRFLDYNVDLDHKDKNSNAVLMYLTKYNREVLVDYLLTKLVFNHSLIVTLIQLGKNHIAISTEQLLGLMNNGYSKIDIDTTDDNRNTPLMYACQEGCYSIANTLINYKADINKDNILNNRPLFFACSSNDYKLAKLLLDTSRIQMNHRNKNGDTELAVACTNDNPQLIELLIDHQSDVNYMNNKDRTFLQAVIFGEVEEVQELLDRFPSINVNVRETNGDTPLIIACQTGKADIALLLLRHHADPNLICECGNTAL
ncbi:hypothetical protein PIROE2DRAFT_53291, partial [Piromyces sp. E2]